MLFNKNVLTNIISSFKSIGSAFIAGFIAFASIALVIYIAMILEELTAWIIKVYLK